MADLQGEEPRAEVLSRCGARAGLEFDPSTFVLSSALYKQKKCYIADSVALQHKLQ